MMLQQSEPDDYVLATGETHSVREFCERTFGELGIQLGWIGEGVHEKGVIEGIDKNKTLDYIQKLKEKHTDLDNFELDLSHLKIGDELIEVDPRYFRPTEVDVLIGDYTKAREKLGWKPEVTFEQLIKIMVVHDLGLAIKEKWRNERISQ